MKKFISIFIITLLIIGVGITEEVFIHNFIQNFNALTTEISIEIQKNEENVNNEIVQQKFSSLKQCWEGNKNKFCYFVMYDKIKALDEGVAKLDIAIKNNDNALAQENIAVIGCYTEGLHYIMGFNFNNYFNVYKQIVL